VNRKKYFAASNTEKGFVSYFSENFRDRSHRCYIIKGGPGTGKSRLMNEMGEAFESAGGCVEYYYCSSDPTSLDGLFVDLDGERVSVIDGTAPHAEDIKNPGVVDNIIDIGRFWDTKILRENSREISMWGRKKSEAYFLAYRALSAYGGLTRMADAFVEDCTDIAAIEEESSKIAVSLPTEPRLYSPLSAIGMCGRVEFDSFRENAHLTLSVTDNRGYGVSYLYLNRLIDYCGGGRISPHSILAGRCSALLLGGVAVVESNISKADEKCVDISEFVDRSAFLSVKERVDHLRGLANGALSEAERSFRDAGEAHMKIEEIFISAMDFGAKEAYSRELCEKIRNGDL